MTYNMIPCRNPRKCGVKSHVAGSRQHLNCSGLHQSAGDGDVTHANISTLGRAPTSASENDLDYPSLESRVQIGSFFLDEESMYQGDGLSEDGWDAAMNGQCVSVARSLADMRDEDIIVWRDAIDDSIIHAAVHSDGLALDASGGRDPSEVDRQYSWMTIDRQIMSLESFDDYLESQNQVEVDMARDWTSQEDAAERFAAVTGRSPSEDEINNGKAWCFSTAICAQNWKFGRIAAEIINRGQRQGDVS